VRGRAEATAALGAYAAYLAVRRVTWTDDGRARARRNAESVLAMERRVGVDVEHRVQGVALRVPALVAFLNAAYAGANVALSVGWLLKLYRRRDPSFSVERTAALAAFLAALPAFARFPTAPPRVLAEFVDTMAMGGWSLDHPLLVCFYNPIAAMPSHHVAFAVVTGYGLASHSSRPWARRGWRGYPALVGLVVVATGNHFVADVAAGAAVGGLARAVAGTGARCAR
jgi:hypothetical protein